MMLVGEHTETVGSRSERGSTEDIEGAAPMDTDQVSSFGDVLKRYRQAAGLTQEALAERAGVSAKAISALESGARRRPHRDTVRLLAEALGLRPEEQTIFVATARPGHGHGQSAVSEGLRGAWPGAHDSRAEIMEPRPAQGGLARIPHNLPVQMTSFIGRDEQLAQLQGLLATAASAPHLVTLTGAGGCGKTRLALEVAAGLLGSGGFPDGIFFAGLASLGDPELVLSTVAHTIGVAEVAGRSPLGSLAEYLRSKALLLVLDNMEHLLAAAAGVATLLESCPRLRVLATSRVPLHIYGEREVSVPPLQTPALDQLPPLDQLATYDAVRLFVARAGDVAADFVLTEVTAAPVAAICVRLDGLPLALELAASRCKVLPPRELLARLEQRLPLLVGGARNLPARHQTLRAAIAWSYGLLGAQEQALFRRLCIFAGGCTLAAAEAVCRAPDVGPAVRLDVGLDVLEGVATLLDHSLLQRPTARHAGSEPGS
jgi:transcriptional regulator with XRE-family HTH domain